MHLIVQLFKSRKPMVLVHAYLVLCITILVRIRITAVNPAYEDTKSSAFTTNTVSALTIPLFAIILGFTIEFRPGIFLESVILGMLVAITPILVIGPLILFVGAFRLTRSDG
jgi:hypothetical protein